MKVELVHFTDDAVNLLLDTKNTRLDYDENPRDWTKKEKDEHLRYMLDTIKSSWEFVDYTFRISGVTRAFTHQLVRTRAGSYAQESMRVVDVRAHNIAAPDMNDEEKDLWDDAVGTCMTNYAALVDRGMAAGDARGLLPTNVTTSIFAKFNLRTLHEMARVRLCTRTQGEYQRVFRAMRAEVIKVHPWAEEFINVQCVADGTCAFPRYGATSCPIWRLELDRTTAKAAAKLRWESQPLHEAKPRAAGGMSHD